MSDFVAFLIGSASGTAFMGFVSWAYYAGRQHQKKIDDDLYHELRRLEGA